MKKILRTYYVSDMALYYLLDTDTGLCGFTMMPTQLENRYTLEGDWNIESMIQVKCIGDVYPVGFTGGHSMRNSGTARKLRFVEQKISKNGDINTISTILESEKLRGIHRVSYRHNDKTIKITSEIKNMGKNTETLELLSSFSICSIFGFSAGDRTGKFTLNRLQSRWSAEGKLLSQPFHELQLEPSWQKYGMRNVKYGQVGSMPVREYFPWFAIEDRQYDCILGGNLGIPSSWQMEVFCEDDRPAVSGGLGDRDTAHWIKKLAPGESFMTPTAELTCCVGDVDVLGNRLVYGQIEEEMPNPSAEKELPVVYNEFCTSWGCPTEEEITILAEKLKGKGITYFVIDAGWYARPEFGWESNMGDWIPSNEQFPRGLKVVADKIRECGMIPGIWFEAENCGKDSEVYHKEEMLLHRDGFPITTYRRRFLDMRKEKVRLYLKERMLNCLKENGFGYLKIDYNDTIGIGCDGEESLGENLRQHMSFSQEFYRTIRREMPELVMENCASGGHRLEPSMMRIFSMASFSDAHECISAPIIAANLHRAVHPSKIQIWAVLRQNAESERLRYILSATFLGRMCLSGDVNKLMPAQWEIVEKAIEFYRKCASIIREGSSVRYGSEVSSYNHPKGYQIIIRSVQNCAMAVIHTFEQREGREDGISERIEKIADYVIADRFGDETVRISLDTEGRLCLKEMKNYDGMVLLLKK